MPTDLVFRRPCCANFKQTYSRPEEMDLIPNKITPRSQVTLHYSISLADGTQLVSTFAESPVICRLGDGTIAETLEHCLLGLSAGSEAQFVLSGQETFGPASPDNLHTIAKSEFPTELSLAPGQIIAFTTPGGDEVAGVIQSMTDRDVLMDFNHPLSNQTITFKVAILDVTNPTT